MLIRPKRPDDTAACAALLVATHHHDGYPVYLPQDPEAFVTTPQERHAWVAVEPVASQDTIVGHVALHDALGDPTQEVAEQVAGLPAEALVVVARLAVHPLSRGRGVARTLLETATAHARVEDRRPVLDVQFDAAGAIRLYESLGWVRIGQTLIPLVGHPALPVWVYLSPS